MVDALVDHAVVAEMLLEAAGGNEAEAARRAAEAAESEEYLGGRVRYEKDRLVDEAEEGVMMEWEAPLMEVIGWIGWTRWCVEALIMLVPGNPHAYSHYQTTTGARGLAVRGGRGPGRGERRVWDGTYVGLCRVVVGFGTARTLCIHLDRHTHAQGIIDSAIQRRGCRSHTIIEAHPDVLRKMEAEGWMDKCVRRYPGDRNRHRLSQNRNNQTQHATHRPNVHVEQGRWQDVVARLVAAGKKFDAIFFDTYAEHYRDMQVGGWD